MVERTGQNDGETGAFALGNGVKSLEFLKEKICKESVILQLYACGVDRTKEKRVWSARIFMFIQNI